jgi:Zn-dependent protease with chaperone function
MKRTWWVLLALLVVPVTVFGVGAGIKAKLDSELGAALTTKFGADRAAQLSQTVTFERICDSPDRAGDLNMVCHAFSASVLLKKGAQRSGGVGLALIVLIAGAGYLTRNNRNLLWRVFSPGLYLTLFVGMGLIILNAVLMITALYYGGAVLVGAIFNQLLVIIGFAALVGLWIMVRGMYAAVRKLPLHVLGKQLKPGDQPALWGLVTEVAARLGTLPPANIVAGLEANFFVTETTVVCHDGKLSDRTLFISLPFCRILTEGELTAILGHELGHFRGADTRFSQRFYPIYTGAGHALRELHRNMSGLGQLVVLWPAAMILSYFLDCFAQAERTVSRERELVADQVAVEASGARVTAMALVKIHAFAPLWGTLEQSMRALLASGKPLINFSTWFASSVHGRGHADAVTELDRVKLAHPTDTHPALGIRLSALGVSLPEVAGMAFATEPDHPAIALIANAETLEEELTTIVQRFLVESGQVPLAAC